MNHKQVIQFAMRLKDYNHMNTNRILALLVIFFGISVGIPRLVSCQTTYIFKDDTLLKSQFMTKSTDINNQPHRCISFYDLKERLPDGEYILLGINRSDSSRKNMQKQILIRGLYQDSVRNGRFDYYQGVKRKGKHVNILTHSYNYLGGHLDGYFFCSNTSHKIIEGYYKDGKEHGFFIHFDFEGGWIHEIEFYIEGTLKYKVRYLNGEMQPLEEDPCNNDFEMLNNQNMPRRLTSPSE